ncbi:hypothetical protein [Fructilactobacillus frigidiflavus]|uniref:hypothetical protein n=1 Tax=Fructilactobacillus frigidiflavus TaxID=3242688 RepID=UPI003756792E
MSEGLANCLLLALIPSVAINCLVAINWLDEKKLEREQRRERMKGNHFKEVR